MIIQQFYFNMHEFDYSVPHFITHVRGTCIVVTSDLISEVLHVPRVEFVDYPAVLVFEMCPKMNSCLFSVRHTRLGVNVKTPLTQALQKV